MNFIRKEIKSGLQKIQSRAEILRKKSASTINLEHKKENILQQTSDASLSDTNENPIILLYYVTGWTTPYCHYTSSSLEREWSVLPGRKLKKVDPASYNHLLLLCPYILNKLRGDENIFEICFDSFKDIEFVFNDNGGDWDKPSKWSNYIINEVGRYIVYQGNVQMIYDAPENPTLFRFLEVGPSHVTLEWNEPIFGTKNIASYNLYRFDKLIKSLDNDTFSYTDFDLLSTTEYIYHVKAVNILGAEGVASDFLKVTTSEPGRSGPVEGLRTVFQSKTKIEIAWQRPLDMGGALIASYLVFKNGNFLTCVPHTDKEWQSATDDTVKPLSMNIYHIVPTRLESNKFDDVIFRMACRPVESEEITDEAKLKTMIEKGILLTLIPNYGQICEGLQVKAVDCHPTPKLSDKSTHIILQAFNWNSCYNKPSWFRYLAERLEDFKKAGISMIWLPPASESVTPQGYMPTRWYNLNSAYGAEVDLLDLLDGMRAHKITPMLDFVVNHRCGTKQDKNGEWSIFEDPPWESWAIVKNNLIGYKGLGQSDTGAQSICAPDIDHTNGQVRQDIKQWLAWLFDLVGFGALRIDMAPGYGSKYQIEYVNSVKTPFTVAEYWSGDTKTLRNYIDATRGLIAVYDFAAYYVLRRAIENNDYSELSQNGRLPGILGHDPEKAVTFIENHDTSHLDFVGKFANGKKDAIIKGLVYILTHSGTPCIYWDHFDDPDLHKIILHFCNLRKEMSITSRARVCILEATQGLYAAYISKDTCPLYKSVLAVKIGTRDWAPNAQGWMYNSSGEGWCVWSR